MLRGITVAGAFLTVGILFGICLPVKNGVEAYRQQVYSTVNESRARLPFVAKAEFHRVVVNNGRIVAGTELGAVTFGAFGAFLLLVNGVKMGMLYRLAVAGGVPRSFWLVHLMPHAVIEYASYLLAEAVAIEAGLYLWTQFNSRPVKVRARIPLIALTCFPIILLAAWVEIYVSPFL